LILKAGSAGEQGERASQREATSPGVAERGPSGTGSVSSTPEAQSANVISYYATISACEQGERGDTLPGVSSYASTNSACEQDVISYNSTPYALVDPGAPAHYIEVGRCIRICDDETEHYRIWVDLLAKCIMHPSIILLQNPTYRMFAEFFPTSAAIQRFQACQCLHDTANKNKNESEETHIIIVRTAILLLQRQTDQVKAIAITELTTRMQSASKKALVSTQTLLHCRNLMRLVYGSHQQIGDPSFLQSLEVRKRRNRK